MKVLITGGAGFIGSTLAKNLIARGDEVVIVDNFNSYYDPTLKRNRIDKLLNNKNLKVYPINICNMEAMDSIFNKEKVDKICNLAAQAGVRYSLENPFSYEDTNNNGFLTILELAKKYEVKDVVYASSSSVYGGNKKVPFEESDSVDHPISIYAATKKTNELYAHTYHHLYGLNCTGLRFFTVYGPWGRPDMALFKFTKNILDNKPIDVYNHGDMKRDFTYIDDIVSGIVASLDNPFPYEVFNLGNDNPNTLMEYIQVLEEKLGMEAVKNMMGMQPGDVKSTWANIDKARKLLGYEPKVRIKEGISNFIDWYLEYHNL